MITNIPSTAAVFPGTGTDIFTCLRCVLPFELFYLFRYSEAFIGPYTAFLSRLPITIKFL